MKIAMFTDAYFPTINGVSYTVSLLKDMLQRKGNSVRVLFPKGNYKPKDGEMEVRSVKFPFYNGYRTALPFQIMKKLGNEDIDIVHIHTSLMVGGIGILYSKRRHIPRVATYHTPLEDYLGYMRLTYPLVPLHKLWEKKILNGCCTITAPSNVAKEELRRKGVRKPIEVIGNGVDLEFFRPVEPTFRENFDADCIIGYCGRHGHEKHLEDLIRIADMLDGKILIAGDGPAHSRYQKMAKGKDNVKFLGFLPRELLPNFYSSLDVFGLPSTVETQGIVALEANACGVPVVGANARALRETIRDGESGYLYEPGNASDLYSKIQKALDEKDELRKKCLEHAKANSLEQSAERFIDVYHRAIEAS